MHFAVAFLSGAPVTPANLLVSRSQCGLSRLRREAYSASQRSARICEFPKQRPAIRAAASTLEVTSDTFEEEVLKSETPVLVDFYASWCGPCKLVAPLMDWAATEYAGKLKVVKIDTEQNTEFVKRYRINGLPTFAVFNGGEAFAIQEGALGKQGLIEYISRHVPNV